MSSGFMMVLEKAAAHAAESICCTSSRWPGQQVRTARGEEEGNKIKDFLNWINFKFKINCRVKTWRFTTRLHGKRAVETAAAKKVSHVTNQLQGHVQQGRGIDCEGSEGVQYLEALIRSPG